MVAQVKGATVKRAIDLLAYEVLAKFKGECGLVLLQVESVGVIRRDIFHCLSA